MSDYDQSIKLDPNNADAYNNRGYVRAESGTLDAAIPDFDRAIKLDPHNLKIFSNRAHVYFGKREFRRAFADWAEAIRMESSNAPEITTAAASIANGTVDRDIAELTAFIERRPQDATLFVRRAIAYGANGNLELTLADLEAALKLKPEYAAAKSLHEKVSLAKSLYRDI